MGDGHREQDTFLANIGLHCAVYGIGACEGAILDHGKIPDYVNDDDAFWGVVSYLEHRLPLLKREIGWSEVFDGVKRVRMVTDRVTEDNMTREMGRVPHEERHEHRR